ncbi:unnamed protein product [Trifolium pratense]|uniref:Uncharacterized protein n=1 Tax=Trifolium pratense TaxID=57577 RepID=A0ACB0KMG6_TRIPR|nr:unnamed protein product [Trifolium pratense]
MNSSWINLDLDSSIEIFGGKDWNTTFSQTSVKIRNLLQENEFALYRIPAGATRQICRAMYRPNYEQGATR